MLAMMIYFVLTPKSGTTTAFLLSFCQLHLLSLNAVFHELKIPWVELMEGTAKLCLLSAILCIPFGTAMFLILFRPVCWVPEWNWLWKSVWVKPSNLHWSLESVNRLSITIMERTSHWACTINSLKKDTLNHAEISTLLEQHRFVKIHIAKIIN